MRTNAGYTITDSIRVGEVEFVIGENPNAPSKYVSWECMGGNNYYWGHYTDSRTDALRDLVERAGQQLAILETLKERGNTSPHRNNIER